jgi:hypothetical protein
MAIERTPTQVRGGVISGRVLLVLIVSVSGAIVALGIAWLLLHGQS